MLAAALFAAAACGSPGDDAPKVTVTIPRGATFAQAVDSLTARGVIDHPGWFRLYARARGLPAALKSGIYTFARDAAWGDVVTTLKAGRGIEVRFTVLEGMMAFEIAERARVWLRIPRDSFFAAVRDTALQRELGIRVNPAGL
ncbi:MAG TPA: endolytic transglycosylase MltG, partial [Gemmatimonadales bacterium]